MGLTEDQEGKLRERLNKVSAEISYLMPKYAQAREIMLKLDARIMALNNEKWAIERQLTPITKCESFKCPTKAATPKRMPKLSDEEAMDLFQRLTGGS